MGDNMQEMNNTQLFKVDVEKDFDVRDVIASVYAALTEKGYTRSIRSLAI